MKNRFLAIVLTVLCLVFCLTGCSLGTYLDSGKKNPVPDGGNIGDNPGIDPIQPGDGDSKHYTVVLYLSNTPFTPPEGWELTAVWRTKNDVVRVPFDANGKADAGELADGLYTVYLTGLPSSYTYDPNGYTASAENRQTVIFLTTVRAPDRGDGSNMYVNNGCFSVRDDGTYRATIAGEGKTLFYEYAPRSTGLYVIESWVNIYDDNINPLFHLYSGSSQFKWFLRTLDGGGAATAGGFTKNFRYEFGVSAGEVGNVCTFAVGAVSKTQEYPLYVDFAIRYVGPYTSDYADIRPQAATQARGKTDEKPANSTFVYADMGTKLYDASNFRISPNTGKYHVYDMEKYGDNRYKYGAGYGPMLLCDITGALPAYSVVNSLYAANNVGVNSSNYLILYNVWIEAEQKFAVYDYTNFIRVDYYGVCNRDGKCYVTEELRKFLQKFAENHSLYTDGVGPGDGTPEINGYSANQDALWLFACGFYE